MRQDLKVCMNKEIPRDLTYLFFTISKLNQNCPSFMYLILLSKPVLKFIIFNSISDTGRDSLFSNSETVIQEEGHITNLEDQEFDSLQLYTSVFSYSDAR